MNQRLLRLDDFVLTSDGTFNEEDEWDLFRVERTDSGRESLSWQLSIRGQKELDALIRLLSQTLL